MDMLNVPYYFCAILKTHLSYLTVKYNIWLANQDVASVSRVAYSDYPFDLFKLFLRIFNGDKTVSALYKINLISRFLCEFND
jgi:hypothetical protein